MRVVAGRLRGRRLLIDSAPKTRPTSDRARAGVFDWLGNQVVEARVLDLFAGSGSLGIEALSRGAQSAVFVERERSALAALRKNLDALELEDITDVVARDARVFLRGASPEQGCYELILADPPYGADWCEELATSEKLAAILVPGGALVLERSVRDPQPKPRESLELRGSKEYGETAFDWFARAEGPP
jgi:16S rRNA (guanine966-N2)-methyltransferase